MWLVGAVIHDPLCPFAEWPDEHCYQKDAGMSMCSLIAKVRADVAQRVYSHCAHTKHSRSAPCIHDEIAAEVRGES